MFISLLALFGGIAIFLFGLKTISQGTESFITGAKKRVLNKVIKTPLLGALTGMVVAGVTQSSVAVSFITVGLVESGLIPFIASAPIIMGANVGTTVTAQLVSLSGGSGVIIGSISSIIGLLLGFSKNQRAKMIGDALMGLGLIFAGLSIMDTEIVKLVDFGWFKSLFLINSPVALFLNGMIMTAVVQSSSAITGITVLLSGKGLIGFKNAVYLTLGSNVGSCFSVVVASATKSLQARRTSIFNLVFNFIGAMIFFPIIIIFGDKLTALFLNDNTDLKRAIANFHTIFNLFSAILLLPFYKLLTTVIEKFIVDKPTSSKKKEKCKTFTSKIRRFN